MCGITIASFNRRRVFLKRRGGSACLFGMNLEIGFIQVCELSNSFKKGII